MHSTYSTYFIVCLALFGAAKCVDWGTITATELSALDPSVFTTVTASDIALIPPASCSGFTYKQLPLIPPPAMAGFSGSQISSLGTYVSKTMTAAQLSFLSANACGGFNVNFEGMSGITARGLTATCLANLTMRACGVISSNFLRYIPATTFKAFTTQCINEAPVVKNVFFYMSPQQVKALPAAAFAGFVPGHLNVITCATLQAISSDQAAKLLSDAKEGYNTFIRECSLTPIAPPVSPPVNTPSSAPAPSSVNWSTLTASQLSDLSPTVFASITSAELASIPAAACAGFTINHLLAIPPSSVAGFSAQQISQIPPAMCPGFTTDQFVYLQPSAIAGFSAAQTGQFSVKALQKLAAFQLAAFTTAACNGFGVENIIYQMSPRATAGFSADCIRNFNTTSRWTSPCWGLNVDNVRNIPAQSFAGFTGRCVYLFGYAFPNVSPAQLSYLTGDACSMLSKYISEDIAASGSATGFKSICVDRFNDEVCGDMRPELITNLTDSACSGFTARCIARDSIYNAFAELSPGQIAAIPVESFAGFGSNQIQGMSCQTIRAISAAQAAMLQSETATQFKDVLKKCGIAESPHNTPSVVNDEGFGLNKFFLAAIGISAVAVIIAIIAVIYAVRIKQVVDPERRGLIANEVRNA